MPGVIFGALGALISGAILNLAGKEFLRHILAGAILGGLSQLLAPKLPTVGAQRADTRHTVTSAVSPGRWIVGRARVGGVLIFYKEVDGPNGASDLHLALILSEGACDAIERIWVRDEELPVIRTARSGAGESGHTITPLRGTDYFGKLWIYEYFDADGSEGDSLQSAAGNDWTAEHRLNGLSWVHVHLRQPSYSDADSRFWSSLPDLNFLVRGLKLTWPGQSAAVWSDNAAAIRYWWLRTRRGLPAAAIDKASFQAAFSLCEQIITFGLPDGYEDYADTGKRYAVNGVIYADDDPERVEDELDFAWQGWAVELDGGYHFRPGAERPIAGIIEPDDIIAIESIRPAPPLQDRINAVTVSLSQSREHDWLEASLTEFIDEGAMKRDAETLAMSESDTNTVAVGTDGAVSFTGNAPDVSNLGDAHNLALIIDGQWYAVSAASGTLTASAPPLESIAATAQWRLVRRVFLPSDLGKRAFVADPIAGGRLLAIALRRARASAAFTYRVKPGTTLERLTVKPGDWLLVTDPEHGLENFQALVIRTVVNEDWSVTLDLTEQPRGVYADTLVLPPLKPRAIEIPQPRQVPQVTGLAVSYSFAVTNDGAVIWHVDVLWDESAYQTRLQVTDEAGDMQTDSRVDGTSQRIMVHGPSTYMVTAYHINTDGFASQPVTAQITFDWSDVPVPPPVILSAEHYGPTLQIVAAPIANRDVTGIEVRYSRGPLDGTESLDEIDEDGWMDAPVADVVLVNPGDTDQPIVANAVIPVTGRYRLFVRLFNRAGNYGPIVEIGTMRLVVPAFETINPQAWPLWLGTLNNLFLWPHDGEYRLYPDYDDRDAVTRRDWNGRSGWPFGRVEGYGEQMSSGSTWYETEVIDLGEVRNIDFVVDVGIHEPPGSVADTQTNYEVYVYHGVAADRSAMVQLGLKKSKPTQLYKIRYLAFRIHLKRWRGAALTRFAPQIRVLS